MLVAVIRFTGLNFDPAKYAREYRFTPEIVWRSGDPDQVGRVRQESGFNLTIADADSSAELVRQVRGWIQHNRSALLASGEAGGAAAIDVGLTVGTSDQFTASVKLSPSDLALL